MHRRRFLAHLGACAVPLALPSAVRLGTAPRLGVQLYTVREPLSTDFERTLARLAAIGFAEVEFAGYHGRDAATVAAALVASGLAAPAAHVGVLPGDDGWPEALAAAERIGHRWLVLPWVDPARHRSLDDWRRLADRLNAAGEGARAHGARFAYHNHDFELAPIGGVRPLELLLARTDPGLVDFEADMHWLARGGVDPAAWLARHRDRVRLAHAKDIGRPPEREMLDVGQGTIDWRPVVEALAAGGLAHLFVEHDRPDDPLASVEAGYRHLSRLALAASPAPRGG